MDYQGPARFRIVYTSTKYDVVRERGPRFTGLAASRLPKVYVFSRSNVPIYIGATIQPMVDRMRIGWKATGAGGFYGWAFRHADQEVDLDVWVDPSAEAERYEPPQRQRHGDDRG